jgi:CubicO group peptidase (beta-lactamase class C family)
MLLRLAPAPSIEGTSSRQVRAVHVTGSIRMVKKMAWLIAVGVLSSAVVLEIWFRPDRAAMVIAGLTAHNLCSAVFVAGLDADATKREQIQAILGATATRLAGYTIDVAHSRVNASFAGLAHAGAEFSPSYGCRLVNPENLPAPLPRSTLPAFPPDNFAPSNPVTATDPALASAIERVFAESTDQPIKNVKAVVILKDGRIIAERYAKGFGVDTPLLSYSVAKSFTNALLGVLVRQGRLRTDQPVSAEEWAAPNDQRAQITIEDLLRMQSGLDAPETESAFSAVALMEYTQADMAGFAARHAAKEPRAIEWEYTSANTLILDRILGRIVGGGAAGMRDFADRELFAPLHMAGVTMEFDGAGVFVGSSYVYAPARTYARLGELYLNDGIAPDGSRILPEGWVAWSRRSTLGSPYGAGFWTNDGPSRPAARRVARGFPKDGFFASGDLGQRIYIIPSKRLVVARFGYSLPPDFGIIDDLALIDTAIRSTESGQP